MRILICHSLAYRLESYIYKYQGILNFYGIWYFGNLEMGYEEKKYIQKSWNSDMPWEGGSLQQDNVTSSPWTRYAIESQQQIINP